MENTLCKLTIVLPTTGADRICELMLASDPPIQGFTTWQAEGHGENFSNVSDAERVRGRVDRSVFTAILEPSRARSLLSRLAEEAPLAHMTYWFEPILEFGRMSAKPSSPAITAPKL